jgi:hypothetical protein
MRSPTTAIRLMSALLGAAILAGCGLSIPVPKIPKIPSIPSFKGSGDTAEFFFDPEQVTLTQAGRVEVDYGVPALRYAGPLGCLGRTFAGDVTDNINFVFRYGARDAWLGWDNGNVWHFTHRPRLGRGTITFAQRFSDGRNMRIVVHCPPPPRSARL